MKCALANGPPPGVTWLPGSGVKLCCPPDLHAWPLATTVEHLLLQPQPLAIVLLSMPPVLSLGMFETLDRAGDLVEWVKHGAASRPRHTLMASGRQLAHVLQASSSFQNAFHKSRGLQVFLSAVPKYYAHNHLQVYIPRRSSSRALSVKTTLSLSLSSHESSSSPSAGLDSQASFQGAP